MQAFRPARGETDCDDRNVMASLDDLRKDIDRVDEVLVRLLNERARCACEIGRLKKEQGIDVYQPDREKQVLHHVRTHGKHTGSPLEGDAIVRVFERIIDEARRIERATAHNSARPRGDAPAGHAGKREDG